MQIIKNKSLIFLLLIFLLSVLLSSCSKELEGKYIPEDQYNSEIIFDSIEFNGSYVQIEAGGQSIFVKYKIEGDAFSIPENSVTINSENVPDVFVYKKLSHSSFKLNDIVYVIEDSLKNQDRDLGSFDDELTTEDLIDEYIESPSFQKFIDSYAEKTEAAGRVIVDAYASGDTLLIEHKYKKAVDDESFKKVSKHYKKYLNALKKIKRK